MNPEPYTITDYNLTNHAPTPEGIDLIEELREAAKAYARVIEANCPASREKSVALTEFETANMWAVAAIARNMTVDAKFKPEVKR